MPTKHTQVEIQEIWDALCGLHRDLGPERLRELGIAEIAEILLEQGDRPAGSWIFANREAWHDFVRTGVLTIHGIDEGPAPQDDPPPMLVA